MVKVLKCDTSVNAIFEDYVKLANDCEFLL